MIITRLMGGLGNQMFQYAAGRALALRRNTGLSLDLSWFGNQPESDTRREYELDCFNITAGIMDPGKSAGILGKISNKLGMGKLNQVNEAGAQFQPDILNSPDNSLLIGYCQNEKYFKDAESAIRKDFTYKSAPEGKNSEFLDMISGSNAVSLHLRRGDYAADKKTNAFHGIPTLNEYYFPAMKTLAEKTGTPHFFVFSDDPAWGKENLKSEFPVTFVDHNPPDKGYEDMRLMSSCRHHIIANSSFSWWGAWLNPDPRKTIVAPKRWFKDEEANKAEIVPNEWIKI